MSGREAQAEVQRSPERTEEKPSRESAGGSTETMQLARLALPVGSPGGSGGPVLRRAMSHSGFAAPALLQLQRQLGNRHVQRMVALAREAPSAEPAITPDVEQSIAGSRGGGRPLDSAVRGRMESSFGTDFGGVRVHTGAEADRLNRTLSARAFTTGSDVFFRDGEYNPGSSGGRELIAHELTHVVQQQGAVQTSSLTLGPPGDRFEQEAESVAQRVMRDEEVSVSPGAGGVARSIQREEDEDLENDPYAEKMKEVVVPAGTFDQAAETFSAALLHLSPTDGLAGIVVINGANIRLYSGFGQPVASTAFRLKRPLGLGPGVYAQPAGDLHLHRVYMHPDGGWVQTPATVTGTDIDFRRDVEPRAPFDSAFQGFKGVVFYIVPGVRPEFVPEEELPKRPQETLPEFMKFDTHDKAELPAWPSAVVPLTPQVAPVGTTGKFYCKLDKISWFGSTIDNVFNLLERANFRWEVLKLDPKLLVTDKEKATRWAATKQRFRTKARHMEEDEKTMRGDAGASVPEKVYREYLTEQLATPRRILGYTGEAVLTLMNSLVPGKDPNVEDYIDFTFKEPGDYFVRCLVSPITGAGKKKRATSVAGVMVSVHKLEDIAAVAIATPEQILENATERLEKFDEKLAKLRQDREAEKSPEKQRQIDLEIGMLEPRRAYHEAVQRAGGDTHGVLLAELELTRAQLRFATGDKAPKFISTPYQVALRQVIEKLKGDEKRLAGQLERADSKLGDQVKRTGFLKAVLFDDVTGGQQEVLLSIGERELIVADRLEVVIADVTSGKGRRFTGMGSGDQRRSDAWTGAMRDLQRNLGRGRGWLSFQAPPPYKDLSQALANPMQLQVAEIDQIKDIVDDAMNAATLAALIAAPFTGGASLGLLAVLVPIQFGSSLYNILNRAMYDDLELDADAVFSLLDIVSLGVTKASTMGKVAKRSVGMMSANGRIALGLLDGGGYVLLSYTTYQEIMKEVPGETPQDAKVRKLRALLGLFQASAIPIAGKLFTKAGVHPDDILPREKDSADAASPDKTGADAPVTDKPAPDAAPAEAAPAKPAPQLEGAPAVPKEYAAALKGAPKKVPPVINPALEKDTVRIQYRQKDGVITEMWMEIAPGTPAARVRQHVPAARDMARYMGLSGRVRKIYKQIVEWLAKNPVAGPESRAWEAEREVKKLQGIIDEQFAAYDKAVADKNTALQDQLTRELDHLESQLIAHAREVDRFDVEGRGFVAAEGAGGTFTAETSRSEAFRELGGFEVQTRDGRVEAGSDLRGFVDAVIHEKLANKPEDFVEQMPDPKGLSHDSVRDLIKDPYLAKLVDRATDRKRLQSLASYREARKGGESVERALHEAATAEAQRIAALLPEGDRAAFLRAFGEKPFAQPVARKRPEAIEPEILTPEPAPKAPEPAAPPAAAPVPEATRAAQAWLDQLRSEVPESAQRRLDGMARGKRPEETRALLERLGGKEYLVGGAREAEARAAALAASPERARAIKDTLAADSDFLTHPEVAKAVAGGNADKLRSEMAAEMAARAAVAGQAGKGLQGVRALRDVRIVREQPHATAADARKALNEQSLKETGKPYEGVIFERGGKVYTVSTDIDVLVLQDVPGQPSKVLRFEQVKSGGDDTPGAAGKQLKRTESRLADIAAGDPTVRLELPDGTDITATIDAASAAGAEKATHGPLDSKSKPFDVHSDVTSRDLLKAAEAMIAETKARAPQVDSAPGNRPRIRDIKPLDDAPGQVHESDWIVATNAAGADVFKSSTPIINLPSHVEGIVVFARRSGKKVTIVTGYHGSADGTTRPEQQFAIDDANYYGKKYPDVQVIDASGMTHAERMDLIDSTGGVVIVSTCYGACATRPSAPAHPSGTPSPAPAPAPAPVPVTPSPAPAAPPPAPVHKTLDQLLTQDRKGFTDPALQKAYDDYVARQKKVGDPEATAEEWISLTRGAARERLELLLGPKYPFGGTGTGVERQLPLTDFARPASYTQARLDADIAAVEKNQGKLWERLGRLQKDGVTGGIVGESLFNILKGNATEILSRGIQDAELAQVQKKYPDARLYDDVRARIYVKGKLTDMLLFTDNVIATKVGKELQLHSVFEVKAGSKGGQEATSQVFDWIESRLDDRIEIQVGGDTYVYEPDLSQAVPNRVYGLARADRHLITAQGVEHLGLDSGDQIARAPQRYGLRQTPAEIEFLARTLIEKHIKQGAAPSTPPAPAPAPAPTPTPAPTPAATPAPARPHAAHMESSYRFDPEMFKGLSESINTQPRASYSVMIEHRRMPSPEQMRELFRDRTPAPTRGTSASPQYGLIETVQGVNVRRAAPEGHGGLGEVRPGLEGFLEEGIHAVKASDTTLGALIIPEAEKVLGKKGDLWFSPSAALSAHYAHDFDALIEAVKRVVDSY